MSKLEPSFRKGPKLIKQSTGADYDFTFENESKTTNTTSKQIKFDFKSMPDETTPNRSSANFSRRFMHSSIDFYRLKLSKSKLKAVTRTSALLSGFAMVAMVELGLDYSYLTDNSNTYSNEYKSTYKTSLQSLVNSNSTNSTIHSIDSVNRESVAASSSKFNIPQPILILYALVTCLLVGVHMLALMISTCILPQIEALSIENFDLEHHYLQRHDTTLLSQTTAQTTLDTDAALNDQTRRTFDYSRSNYHPVGYDSILNETNLMFPYIQYHRFIELAWISSTVLGIFLFLVEIGLVCYIKFYPISFFAAMTGAVVMIPILILFVVFTITFYKRLAGFKVNLTKKVLSQVDGNLIPLKSNII